jgi:branched-chain amino acid transport system substrate-binding protein
MKKIMILLLTLLMVFSFTGCDRNGDKPGEDEPIKIGLTDAFTGDRAGNGQYTKEGVDMFLEYINGKGGVLGREVVVVYEDDQGNETAAVNAYQKLILENEDLTAVVLNKYSSVVLAMEPYVADSKIPAICSGSNVKIEQSTNPYLYSTRRSDYGSGATMAAFIKQEGAKRVAILYSPDALGKGMSEIVIAKLQEAGIEVVSSQQFSEGEKQFANYVAKIKESNPDFIVCIGQTSETGLIVKAIYDAGLNHIKCIGNSAFAQATTIEQAGLEASEGWYSITAFAAGTEEEPTASWIRSYTEKYGHAPEMTSVTTYDALSMICYAIEKANSTDPEAVNAELKKILNFEGIAAVYSYNGNPMLANSEFVIQIQNGKAIVLTKVIG